MDGKQPGPLATYQLPCSLSRASNIVCNLDLAFATFYNWETDLKCRGPWHDDDAMVVKCTERKGPLAGGALACHWRAHVPRHGAGAGGHLRVGRGGVQFRIEITHLLACSTTLNTPALALWGRVWFQINQAKEVPFFAPISESFVATFFL